MPGKKNKKQKLHVHVYTSDKPVSIYQDPLHRHKTLYKPIISQIRKTWLQETTAKEKLFSDSHWDLNILHN